MTTTAIRTGRAGAGAAGHRSSGIGAGTGGRTGTTGPALGAALDLVERARTTLLGAARAETTTQRYVDAQLGALRAAAALLALAAPVGGGVRSRAASAGGSAVRDVWGTLAAGRPEFAEWAAYFAVCTQRRREIEAGAACPGPREADDTLRAAATFLGLVQAALGLPVTRVEPALCPASPAPASPAPASPAPASPAPASSAPISSAAGLVGAGVAGGPS